MAKRLVLSASLSRNLLGDGFAASRAMRCLWLVSLGLGLTRGLALAESPAATQPSRSSEPVPLTALIPADSLIVYAARPYDATAGPSASGPAAATQSSGLPVSITSVLGFLNASGMIPDEGQVYVDIASSLPLLGRFEHALVLLDVSSKIVRTQRDDADGPREHLSLKLDQLQTAVVFRTNGEQQIVLDHLNRIVSRYTNASVAELSPQQAGRHPYQRLADERLPGWAIWEWGRLDDFFVVTFGAGAFDRVAQVYDGQRPRLADDTWFKQASTIVDGADAQAQWFIALSTLEHRLRGAARGRHSRVVRELEADNMTHDLWAIGRDGRALKWFRYYRRNGEDTLRRYSDPTRYPAHLRRVIPRDAQRYGIINVPTRWLVDNLPRAWIAARSEESVETYQRIWQRFEEESGVDISASLIDHLGDNVVVFDYPPHPLRIPFALTVAIEIDDRRAVQLAVDTLLSAWSRYLNEKAKRSESALVRLKVRQAPDGIWFLQAGILGPALKVTDRYVVVSWSPQALRDALSKMHLDGPSGPDR